MIKSILCVSLIFIVAYIIIHKIPTFKAYADGLNYVPVLAHAVSQISPKSVEQPTASPGQLSPDRVDAILCAAGSPACGTGTTFYQGGIEYGIDDRMALAFFHHESSYGLAGVAVETHGIGNIICTPGWSCIGRFRAYTNWNDGIIDWYRLISGPEYRGSGLITVGEIIPKYAPASENNCTAYIASVQADIERYR